MLTRCSTGEQVTKSHLCEPCLMHPARLPCQTPSPELTPSQPSTLRRLALELHARYSVTSAPVCSASSGSQPFSRYKQRAESAIAMSGLKNMSRFWGGPRVQHA